MHSFRITVRTRLGPLSVRRDTAQAALETGRALDKEALGAVTIAAADGRELDLAAFEAFTKEARPED